MGAWLAHYLENHTRIMATFPGIREVEVCSRIDWCGALPWPRVDHMQRNKVVFDDGDALKAAMTSPVMQDMRADFHNPAALRRRQPALSDGDSRDRRPGRGIAAIPEWAMPEAWRGGPPVDMMKEPHRARPASLPEQHEQSEPKGFRRRDRQA